MIIRKEQMQVFSAMMFERFCVEMTARARNIWGRSFPGRTEEQWRQNVERWINRAKGYGLRSERDVVRYLDSTCAMGEGFEDRKDGQWARQLLTDPALAPELKAVRLWQRVKALRLPVQPDAR